MDELKKGLGKEWHVLIDALLEKNGEDAGSSAEEQRAKRGPDSYSPAAIHTALQVGHFADCLSTSRDAGSSFDS